MEKISWTNRVRNEVLHKFKDRNILQQQERTATGTGQMLRRNCHLKHVIAAKIERNKDMTRRLGRRRKQLLQDPKEKIRAL